MEIIKIENLSFTYPASKRAAIHDINLSINDGEFIVICGESGCGKTTLMKLMKYELAPYGDKRGTIYYKNKAQEDISARTLASEIGYVMQNPENQIVTDKVWHELAFGLENIGCPREEIRRRAGEMANYFGIDGWFRKSTRDLSGGQKQLLNLASIMAMQPEVLLLDEPTSQLDPIAASEFISTIVKLNREMGLTIIIAEHRLEELFSVADKIVVMDSGEIKMCDTPEKVGENFGRNYPNHRMLYGFPSSIRIYNGLKAGGRCPLNIREGKQYVRNHYKNEIRSLLSSENNGNGSGMKDGPVVLELKKVYFRYEKDLPDILENVNLKVEKQDIVSILGGNGAGKTTLLNAITGCNKIYRGKILINGKKLKEYNTRTLFRNNLAFLPQNPQLVFLKPTVREDYEEIIKPMDYTKTEMRDAIDKIAELLNIGNLMEKHPYDLSGGEQQKAALGKVLLLKPSILLLDEPTKGLDAFFRRGLINIFRKLKMQGVTIIFVTHDIEFAAQVSDKCCLFFDRSIVSCDIPAKFFSKNTFYTTASNRISRGYYDGAITCEDVIKLCTQNGEKDL